MWPVFLPHIRGSLPEFFLLPKGPCLLVGTAAEPETHVTFDAADQVLGQRWGGRE